MLPLAIRYIRSLLLPGICLLLLEACSWKPTPPTPEERHRLENSLKSMGPEYSSPRLVTAELSVNIHDLKTMGSYGESEESPALRIWSAGPLDNRFQQLQGKVHYSIVPTARFVDSLHGNRIAYWDVLSLQQDQKSIALTRRFTYLTFDWRPVVNRDAERQNWDRISPEILSRYTRAEMFLEQEQALVDTVFGLLQDIAGPVEQAEAIFQWVRSRMEYIYPPEERGVQSAFRTLRGDCGQYAALFISMSRIAGIPARQQSGFNFHPQAQSAHVWCEIFLPIKGWVPVDATREDGFLHLDNQRLIMSTGLNIPLEHAPAWATFENSEVQNGKTDFMQMFTLVRRGVEAKIRSERKIIRSVEL